MKKIIIIVTTMLAATLSVFALTTSSASASGNEGIPGFGYITFNMDRGGYSSFTVHTEDSDYYDDDGYDAYTQFIDDYGYDDNIYNPSKTGIAVRSVNVLGNYYDYVHLAWSSDMRGEPQMGYMSMYNNGSLTEKIYMARYISDNNYSGIVISDARQKPGISGKDSIVNNIDKPYTLEEIKTIANIRVHDAYYGDLTAKLQIKNETYSANSKKVGNFSITYTVTNDFGLSNDYTLNVINRDFAAPLIEGPAEKTISYKDAFAPTDIFDLFIVTDNHDTDVDLQIDENPVDFEKNKVGSFAWELYAVDTSGNRTDKEFTLNVIDDIAPDFVSEHEGIIQLNYKDTFTDSKLLVGLSLLDEIDGELNNAFIDVIDNGGIKNKVGKYIVKYSGKDRSGNIAYYEREYEVITTDAPEYWVSQKVINIEDINSLTKEQIIDIIASYENIDYANYQIITDEYTGNENTAGNYNIRIAFTDDLGNVSEHSRILTVFSGDELNTEVDGFWYKLKNFFNKVWNGIKTVFNFILKVITAPFKWLGKLLGFGKTKSVVVTRFRL